MTSPKIPWLKMKGKLNVIGLLTDGTTYKTELDLILWRSVFAVHFVPLKNSNLPEESAAARRILKGKWSHRDWWDIWTNARIFQFQFILSQSNWFKKAYRVTHQSEKTFYQPIRIETQSCRNLVFPRLTRATRFSLEYDWFMAQHVRWVSWKAKSLFVSSPQRLIYTCTGYVVRQKCKLKIVTSSFQACLKPSALPSGHLRQSYRFLNGAFLDLPQDLF